MPPFNHDNAAILGRKGAIARWSKPPPEPVAVTPAAIPAPIAVIAAEVDTFQSRRLERVRAQLDLVDAAIQRAAEKTLGGKVPI